MKHARSRWKTLRDYFRQEVTKIEKPRSGAGGDVTTSSWQYFALMGFLRDTMVSEGRSCSLGVPAYNHSLSPEISKEVVSGTEEDNATPPYSVASPQEQTSSDVTSVSTQGMRRENRKRMRPDIDAIVSKNDALIAIEKQKLELLQKDMCEEKDDDLMFLKSLLPDLKSLPRSRNRLVRLKFQEIMYNEIEALEERANVPKRTEGNDLSAEDAWENASVPSGSTYVSL